MTLPLSTWVTTTTGADPSATSVTATHGKVTTTSDGITTYTAPNRIGPDTLTATVCPTGSDDCVTSKLTVDVVPGYEPLPHVTRAVITDRDGHATFTVALPATSGPAEPGSLKIVRQPSHGAVTSDGTTFTFTAPTPAFSDGIKFTYISCAEADPSDCKPTTVILDVNTGFGWNENERETVQAGASTVLNLPALAEDAKTWGLTPESVTATTTTPGVTFGAADTQGRVAANVASTVTKPFSIHVCASGRNDVPFCTLILASVTPAAIVIPGLTPKPAMFPSPAHVAAKTPVVAGSTSETSGTSGDVTWWVIVGACLFGLGGGITTFRKRQG